MMMGATTHNTSPGLAAPPAGYADWLTELKTRIHSAQQRATLAVNRALVLLYWQIGQDNMRAFAEAWPDAEFVQQAAALLPWGSQPGAAGQAARPANPPLVCGQSHRKQLVAQHPDDAQSTVIHSIKLL